MVLTQPSTSAQPNGLTQPNNQWTDTTQYISTTQWTDTTQDAEFIYLHFVDIVLHILSECVPAKTAVLGPKDPQYVTPLVKMLLKRRNRLRRQGRHDEANVVTQKINNLITTNRSSSLDDRTSKLL